MARKCAEADHGFEGIVLKGVFVEKSAAMQSLSPLECLLQARPRLSRHHSKKRPCPPSHKASEVLRPI
jgi:hypothetical protein